MPASMDSLSPEILELIILHLFEIPSSHHPKLYPQDVVHISPYSTISRKWRYAVERFSFAEVHKLSSDLDELRRIFSSPRRKKLLRCLDYVIDLPTYSKNRIFCFERARESRENQKVFNREVKALFDELSTWDTQGITLTLKASSPMDGGRRSRDLPVGLNRDFHDIYLRLDDDVDLPCVPSIGTLQIHNGARGFYPSAIGQMISSLPNLEKLALELNAPKPQRPALQKDYRLALANALSSPLLSNLRHLSIYIEEVIPRNHNITPPTQDPDYPNGDELNKAIRHLAETTKLQSLNLTGSWLLSPALFKSPSPFPHLQKLKVQGALITYDGRWLYTGDPASVEASTIDGLDLGSGDEDSDSDSNSSLNSEYRDSLYDDREDLRNGNVPHHQWRTEPDSKLFDPLVKAMAGAVLRMPSLLNMEVSVGMEDMDYHGIVFECLGPGQKGEWESRDLTVEELEQKRWSVTLMPEARWEVPDGIRDLWREGVGEKGRVSVDRF